MEKGRDRMFTDEEYEELYAVFTSGNDWQGIRAVATRAIELLAARNGAMSREGIDQLLASLDRQGSPVTAASLRAHLAGLGAEIVQLRAGNAVLARQVNMLEDAQRSLTESCKMRERRWAKSSAEASSLRAELARLKSTPEPATGLLHREVAATTAQISEARKHYPPVANPPTSSESSPATCGCREKNIACIHQAVRYMGPSGQVAEDVARLSSALCAPGERAALSRLAALAQLWDVMRSTLESIRQSSEDSWARGLAARALTGATDAT